MNDSPPMMCPCCECHGKRCLIDHPGHNNHILITRSYVPFQYSDEQLEEALFYDPDLEPKEPKGDE